MNRVRTAPLVLVCSLLGCLGKAPNDMAWVGQPVPAHFMNYNQGALLDASTLLHTYAAPGGRFRAAVDNNNIVRMIIPVAASFRSPEGISQQSTLRDVKKVTGATLVTLPGYGYLLQMPSGWTAVFSVGKTMTDSEPKDDHKVAFICQR